MLPLGQDCQEIISEDTANPFTSQVIHLQVKLSIWMKGSVLHMAGILKEVPYILSVKKAC